MKIDTQVIMKEGEPEWAVLPYKQYQALLQKAGMAAATEEATVTAQTAASAPSVATAANTTTATPDAVHNLESLRNAKGLNVNQVARDAGISPSYLKMIEAGERQPDQAVLRGIAQAFGMPVDDLKQQLTSCSEPDS